MKNKRYSFSLGIKGSRKPKYIFLVILLFQIVFIGISLFRSLAFIEFQYAFDDFNYFLDQVLVELEKVSSVVFWGIVCCFFYWLFDNNKKIEFDEDYIYFSTKNTQEKISLRNVIELKKPAFQLQNTKNWVVKYRNNQKEIDSYDINITFQNKKFKRFVSFIEKKNPEIKKTGLFKSLDLS